MKQTIALLILVFNINILLAHRESVYCLEGVLNNKNTVLKIEESGEQCYANYYETDNKIDHTLNGYISTDTVFILMSYKWDSASQTKIETAKIRLREIKKDVWQGTLSTPNGEDSIFFKPLVLDINKTPYNNIIKQHYIDTYSASKLANIGFNLVKTETLHNGVKIEWVIEPRTEITFFRVIPDTTIFNSIDILNQKLLAEHIKLILAKLSCTNIYNHNIFNAKTSVSFINSTILSYSTTINSSCYGGTEDYSKSYHNIDIESGKSMILEDLIWFGEVSNNKIEKGSTHWYKYRYTTFSNDFLKLLSNEFPTLLKTDSLNNFSQTDIKKWQFPLWHAMPKGLYVESNLPYQTNANKNSVIIPWKALKPYLTQEQKIDK